MSAGKDALSGAMSGGTMGAGFGAPGIAIGAGVGGLAGYLIGLQEEADQKKLIEQQRGIERKRAIASAFASPSQMGVWQDQKAMQPDSPWKAALAGVMTGGEQMSNVNKSLEDNAMRSAFADAARAEEREIVAAATRQELENEMTNAEYADRYGVEGNGGKAPPGVAQGRRQDRQPAYRR